MKISPEGQITIPKELRLRFGLLPDTEIELIAAEDGVKVIKAASTPLRGRALIEFMRGRGEGILTTNEILEATRSEV